MIKIKVYYDCNEDNEEILTLEEFQDKFNNQEICSALDTIEFIEA